MTAPPAVDVDLDAVARLRLAVTRVARRVRRHSAADMSPSRLSALTSIQRNGPMHLSRLADREQISRSTLTRLIAGLEDDGLVERIADPADRRSWYVDLTDECRVMLAAANRRADHYIARQLVALDAEDQRLLVAALPALERLLDAKA